EPLKLTQKYVWDSLGMGQCPNAGQLDAAALRLTITTDPAAATMGYLQDEMVSVMDLTAMENMDNTPEEEQAHGTAMFERWTP
ncbi:MAG: hypothetical protein HC914_17925, partial [Chloroflexaceae bacterium]|nr:hypothetical protein [Chloroflexaceae bacterium]